MPTGHEDWSLAKEAWYDRNADIENLAYEAAGVGPHSITIRDTYQVPTGKKAMIQSAVVIAIRASAPSAAGLVDIMVSTAAPTARIVQARFLGANIADGAEQNVGLSSFLPAGSTFAIGTVDISTGGTVDYLATSLVSEFDA